MLKVGITGGIGAGKSIICKLFLLYGIKVYNADYFAKYLMQNDVALVKKIKTTFGEEVYAGKQLNREKLASIVFTDTDKLNQLNNLVHPAIAEHSLIWMEKQTGFYVLKEAALLFETNSYQFLDYNILVTAPKQLRINRVVKRDNTEADSVKKRMNKQLPDTEKKVLADFVITNDDVEPLIPQVNNLHQKLLKLAKTIS